MKRARDRVLNVRQLSKEQLRQLKVELYDRFLYETKGRNISYDEMVNIDMYVKDKEIYKEYRDIEFTLNDFWT